MLLWKVRSREEVGRVAAAQIAAVIKRAHMMHGPRTTVVLAAAPSQEETLKALLKIDGIPWPEVCIGHMDEYLWEGRKPGPQSFSFWLEEHFIKELRARKLLGRWIPIDGTATDPEAECRRLNAQFQDGIHVLANGIGVNGHCGFEDPGADLLTPEVFRVRRMDLACRKQQVDPNDRFLFKNLEEVPHSAITLTIPAAMRAGAIVASVIGETKAPALRDAFEEAASNRYPFMCAMRWHRNAVAIADQDATSQLTFNRSIPFYEGG